MNKKRLFAAFATLVAGATALSFAACKPKPDPDPEKDPPQPPAAKACYVKDADVITDGEMRYVIYTTNETSGETDSVIAVRKGTYADGEGWKMGDEKIVLRGGEAGAWDENLASASLVKGTFTFENASYSYLMAYCATKETNDKNYSIGLAVATAPDGEWKKIADTPIVAYDSSLYGKFAGCYAPSLVNLDKASKIRLFYTYADSFGHFAKFVDFNASNLSAIDVSGEVQCPNNGSIASGDAVALFPNADFAYDGTAKKFYAVKDYSPAATTKPAYAERIQLLAIAEGELYTAEVGDGWQGLRTWDSTDTQNGDWERLYSACIVSDAYGQIDGGKSLEIVYTVCELEADNDDWEFTQKLQFFTYASVAQE